jgi:CheY-like chemotaxis protein
MLSARMAPQDDLSTPSLWDADGPPSPRLRVLLVDDHAMVRQGLRSVLETYPDMAVIGEASDGHEAVLSAKQLQPR